MTRSGYTDDCEHLELYRSAVHRAITGKRGQAFLRELADAMDAMPDKALITQELIDEDGYCCTMGVVCKSRGIDVAKINYTGPESVAKAVGIAESMAAEIEHLNDECSPRGESPGERWVRMRKWVEDQITRGED